MTTTKATNVLFRACCNRPHCRVYILDFVNSRGRVFASMTAEGIEWQELFHYWHEGIGEDRMNEAKQFSELFNKKGAELRP